MEKSLIIEKSEKLIAYSDAKTNNKNSFLPRIWVLNESDLRGTIRQEGEQTRKARKVNMILKNKRETNKSAYGPIWNWEIQRKRNDDFDSKFKFSKEVEIE